MSCQYVKVTSYADFPQCTLLGKICPYMYRCTTKLAWIPLESMQYCKEKSNGAEIPEGANRVRFLKNGFLYVEYKDGIITIPYDKEAPEYVFLENRNGKMRIKE